jgi:hypothetical protein
MGTYFSDSFAQKNCKVDTGTYYSMDVCITFKKPQRWPVTISCITTNLGNLKLVNKNQHEFICSLVQSCKYVIDDETTLLENLQKYSPDLSDDETRAAVTACQLKEQALHQIAFKYKFTLADGNMIWISVQKFKGGGWLSKTALVKFQDTFDLMHLPNKLYHNKYFFSLKEIEAPIEMSESEKSVIQEIF